MKQLALEILDIVLKTLKLALYSTENYAVECKLTYIYYN